MGQVVAFSGLCWTWWAEGGRGNTFVFFYEPFTHIAGRSSLKDEQAKTQKHLCQVDVESVVYNKRTVRCSSLPSWAPALPSDYTFQGTSVKVQIHR